MKILILLFISIISFGRGEISFKKQKEKNKNDISMEKVLDSNTASNVKNNNKKLLRDKVIDIALQKLNSPYLWGASGDKNFDCSSFVQYVYSKIDIKLPRVSSEQSIYKPKISNVRKGDLLFFDTLGKNRITHVGIYIGDNKFIHASSSKNKVVISELKDFYKEKFRWAISPF